MNIPNILKRFGITLNYASTTMANPVTHSSTTTHTGAVTNSAAVTNSSTVHTAGITTTASGVGAVAGTGVTVSERGVGVMHQTVFTFTNTPVVLADEAGVVAYGGLKIYDFPAGYIYTMGGSADLALTKSSAGVNNDWDGDIAVGTATASNNNSLSGTEADVFPSTATPQAVAGATTGDMVATVSEFTIKDGHSTAKDLYLNILIDDADHDVTGTACNIIVNGTLTLNWLSLGDN